MSKKSYSVVSHRKDADGISSAALIRYMTGGEVYLADYADMTDTLSSVHASEVYISDLGLNKNTFDGFFEQLTRLRKTGEVHYIDHHPIHPNYAAQLRSIGVDLYHSVAECASVLIYGKYEQSFENSPQMRILACAGAITDYMDLAPFAKKLVASFDRQFLLYEATVLSFTIATIGRGSSESNSLLIKLVKQLAEGKLPHEVPNASSLAQEYASRSAELIERVRKEGKKRENYAYFLTKESATGNVANFLVGAFNVPVGVALREEEPGYLEISLRSTEESKHDLGKIVGGIATNLNTSGGGHPHASGARIKTGELEKFLQMLDDALAKPVA
ncbi:MAG: DHHA1 domain-containing protein [Nitrososphaerales archaeon]